MHRCACGGQFETLPLQGGQPCYTPYMVEVNVVYRLSRDPAGVEVVRWLYLNQVCGKECCHWDLQHSQDQQEIMLCLMSFYKSYPWNPYWERCYQCSFWYLNTSIYFCFEIFTSEVWQIADMPNICDSPNRIAGKAIWRKNPGVTYGYIYECNMEFRSINQQRN